MVGIPRQSLVGFPVKLPKSAYTQVRVAPVDGYTDSPDLQTSPGSITSGRNVWIWQNRLQPRPRLQQLGTSNPLGDAPTGAFVYNDVNGAPYVVVASTDTVSYLNGSTWQPLTYVSGTSNLPLSGGANDLVFGASVYLPRADTNLGIITNGVDPLFAWGGPSNGTGFSTLTQAPIAKDVALYDTRCMAWNVRYLSSTSQLVTRIQWSVKGNPEDWTSIGAGYQDLFDMAGVGTRVIARIDEIMVCTDQEIWRGAAIGPPFDFSFTPFSRTLGVPYARCAIDTPDGFFWVGRDLMVYRIQPYYWSQIEKVGAAIQRLLHNSVTAPEKMFFGYHADAKQLTLYYQDQNDAGVQHGITLNTITGTWTPQQFSQQLVTAFTSPVISSSTQWDQLPGSFAAQTMTYNQLLGTTSDFNEATISSTGTVYIHEHPSNQATDDGIAVEQEAQLGALFAAMPERRKFVDTIRLDARCDSASSMSVAISPDLGNTFPVEQQFALSVQSATSQQIMRCGVDGVYHMVRLRSTGGAWEVMGLTVRGKVGGEAI